MDAPDTPETDRRPDPTKLEPQLGSLLLHDSRTPGNGWPRR